MGTHQQSAGELMRRARLRKGWTLRQAAQACADLGTPVDFGNIARYERDEKRPGPGALLVLSRALNFSIDAVLDLQDAR
jgi:transcriptional regulator with XRE-family HTH domain